MEKVLSFQISLFGSFINIQPNIEISTKLIEAMSHEGFIPSTFEVNTVDPNTKSIVSETRLRMVSNDRNWMTEFLQERIDLNYMYHGGDAFFTSTDEIIEKGKSILKCLYSTISETTGARLAVNGKFLLPVIEETKKQEAIRRLMKIPSVIGDRALLEFSVHYNSPLLVRFGQFSEECNSILDIMDIVGIDTAKHELSPRMVIGIDINTSQANTDLRKYRWSDLTSFTDAVLPLFNETIDDVEKQML